VTDAAVGKPLDQFGSPADAFKEQKVPIAKILKHVTITLALSVQMRPGGKDEMFAPR
jgi:hypothetical protein